MIRFENPWALSLIILLPLFLVLRKARFFDRIYFPLSIENYGTSSANFESKASKVFSFLSGILGLAAFLCVIIALSSPVSVYKEKIYTTQGAEIFIIMDVSPSMAAKNENNITRFDKARTVIRNLVNGSKGTSFALIAMATNTSLIVPPTLDHDTFLTRLDMLYPGEFGDSTAIGLGLSSAVYHSKTTSSSKKSIILLTDGENNAGEINPSTAASMAFNHGISLYIVGIGSDGKEILDYIDRDTGKKYKGEVHNFDERNLIKLASVGGGEYFYVDSMENLQNVLSKISLKENVVQNYYFKSFEKKYYDRILIMAFFCIILAWFVRRLCLKEIL